FTNSTIFLSGSTVNYASTAAQNISNVPTYGNLLLTGASIKTASGAFTVANDLTVSAGTLADGGNTVTVNGNATNNATHLGSGKILLSGGTNAHTLAGTGSYNNLELNSGNAASITGSSNVTISGTLTLPASGTFSV